VVGCWCGGMSGGVLAWRYEWWGAGVERGTDLHMAQLMPPCFSKIRTGFIFLVLAGVGSPGLRAIKCVCVCDY